MRKNEDGYVLISVILGVSLVLLTLLVASTFTQLGSRLITLQLNYQGQALNAAQAGVTEGLDWFRRQPGTVTAFTPTLNLSANPPVNDTDVITTKPSIQRDYLISSQGNVWAHYEVDTGCSAIPPAVVCPLLGAHVAGGSGVLDISQNRNSSWPAGTVWQLESTGVVYVRNTSNMSVLYNQSPNQVLASKTVRSEISKIAVAPPANAALSIPNCSNVAIGSSANQVRVVGGPSGIGVGCSSGSISPAPSSNLGSGATLSGNGPWQLGAGSFALTNVFGVTSQGALANLADINVNNESALPNPLPPMQLIMINKGAGQMVTFGPSNPLNGSGILVVIGNLTIASDPNPSSFNGVIYVSGTYTQTQPSTINGTVIVAGSSANIQGSGSFSEVYWDPFMMNQVKQQLRQYRFSRPGYIPCPSWDTNCNSRFAGS